jgi:phosphate transport system protein
MATRTEFIRQLEEISNLIDHFTDKAVADVRAAGLAMQGDKGANEGILAGQKTEESLRSTLESRCFDVLLLQQPLIGEDLRFVTAAFRIVSDLSRIDSMTRDIAFLVHELPAKATDKLAGNAMAMSNEVAGMVESAVEAFKESSVERAEAVIASDDAVNDLYDKSEAVLVELMKSGKSSALYLPELLMVAKYFERIGDHAKRIADWAIFRKTGEHSSTAGKVTDILLADEGKSEDTEAEAGQK